MNEAVGAFLPLGDTCPAFEIDEATHLMHLRKSFWQRCLNNFSKLFGH
jgi:hypothetical protein